MAESENTVSPTHELVFSPTPMTQMEQEAKEREQELASLSKLVSELQGRHEDDLKQRELAERHIQHQEMMLQEYAKEAEVTEIYRREMNERVGRMEKEASAWSEERQQLLAQQQEEKSKWEDKFKRQKDLLEFYEDQIELNEAALKEAKHQHEEKLAALNDQWRQVLESKDKENEQELQRVTDLARQTVEAMVQQLECSEDARRRIMEDVINAQQANLAAAAAGESLAEEVCGVGAVQGVSPQAAVAGRAYRTSESSEAVVSGLAAMSAMNGSTASARGQHDITLETELAEYFPPGKAG
eukprot:m.246318 g.246318  ORF g.246318 m.246318 type:complete len:299 (-) comp42462_c0_seq1:24-920(-)